MRSTETASPAADIALPGPVDPAQFSQAAHQVIDRVKVAINAFRLIRKAFFESRGKVFLTFGDIEPFVTDEDMIKTVRV